MDRQLPWLAAYRLCVVLAFYGKGCKSRGIVVLRRSRDAGKPIHAARRLYQAIVARARAAVFHSSFSVPDTIDGRFDLLVLHTFPVMDALKSRGAAGSELGTKLANLIFAGFDDALRELGVGDFGIARRIKAMANAFYGRLEAYGAASSVDALAVALARNLFRGDAAHSREAAALAHYIHAARDRLRADPAALLDGAADFGPAGAVSV